MKKGNKLIVWLILLAADIVLAGCRGKEETGRTSEAERLTWCVAGVLGYDTDEVLSDKWQEEINQQFAEKGMDVQVEFQVITSTEGEFSEKQKDIIADSDLITIQNQMQTGEDAQEVFKPTVEECVKEQLLEPLDEFLGTGEGADIKEKMLTLETLEAGRWDDTQWVLPTSLVRILGPSLGIEKKLFEKADLSMEEAVPDFTKCDDMFAKLYEANGNRPFMSLNMEMTEKGINRTSIRLPYFVSEVLENSPHQYMEMAPGVGALVQKRCDKEAEVLIGTDYLQECFHAWKRYAEKGYITTDRLAPPLVWMEYSYQPEARIQNTDSLTYVIPKSDLYVEYIDRPSSRPIQAFVGIGANSKKKEQAFQVLSKMIIEEAFQKIFKEIAEEGRYSLVFQSELSEEGEETYKEISAVAPHFVCEYMIPTIRIPELETVNELLEAYCQEGSINVDSAAKIWSQKLIEELDEAGIGQVVSKINEGR